MATIYQFWRTSTSIRDLYLFQIRLKKSTSLLPWWLNTIFESALKVLSFAKHLLINLFTISLFMTTMTKNAMMIDTLNMMSAFFRQNNGEQGMSWLPPLVKLLFWKNWNALRGGGWLFLKVIFANMRAKMSSSHPFTCPHNS